MVWKINLFNVNKIPTFLVTGERRGFGYSSENARDMSDPRWNATKHACTSSRLLLPDESPAELDELLEGLREQYLPETTLDLTFVVEAARAIWTLKRNNRRYDEYEQALHEQEPDSTKWTAEQWHQLDLRTRYRTTAERGCTRALRNLAHIRGGRGKFAAAAVVELKPKEEKKKPAPAEKPLELPKAGPPPLYQRIVVTEAEGETSAVAYPETEQLRAATKDVAQEAKFERIFEYPSGVHASFRMNVGMWRKLIALEEARRDGRFLNPEEAG